MEILNRKTEEAMVETVYGYETTIAWLEEKKRTKAEIREFLHSWKYYGGACAMCYASKDYWNCRNYVCHDCPLHRENMQCYEGDGNTLLDIRQLVADPLSEGEPIKLTQERLIQLFMARLRFILSRFDYHGYEMEEVNG